MKMTFREFLTEATIMSRDALKQAMRDYPQRQMGKGDGSKPKPKRLDQMDKRKKRKAGFGQEEEEVKKPELLRRQSEYVPAKKRNPNLPRRLPDMLTKQSGL